MTHTPGPWQIGGELISQKGTNKEIASVWAYSANRKFSPRQSEADANARLITEAPELLKAAQRLTGISWAVGSLALDDSIEQLRAVIAKATG